MKHIIYTRRRSMAENRRIQLKTIILPPLTPTFEEESDQMLRTILVSQLCKYQMTASK